MRALVCAFARVVCAQFRLAYTDGKQQHVDVMNRNQLIEICKAPDRKEQLKSVTKENMVDAPATTDAAADGRGQSELQECVITLTQEVKAMKKTMERVAGVLD